MRLSFSKSANAESIYIIKDVTRDGKRTTEVFENLGTVASILEATGGRNPYEWAKERLAEVNAAEKEGRTDILARFSPSRQMEKDDPRFFKAGYLFLQQLFYKLGLHKICADITERYQFAFNLESILSRLIYLRILEPSSKRSAFEASARLLEAPDFELHQIYRALSILAKESRFIQSEVYARSKKVVKRDARILYYDCTNYYFEVDEESGKKTFAVSKEGRPNPVIQMGLFMDAQGMPIAFDMWKGSTSEQLTMQPLEEKILQDFKLSQVVVCTDAGLNSQANREFNTQGGRAFVVTQSLKKLKAHLQAWALDPNGWHLVGSDRLFTIEAIDKAYEKQKDHPSIDMGSLLFHKERWIKENGFEQRMVVTYSPTYKVYLRHIRAGQITRAADKITATGKKKKTKRPNDPERFIQEINYTSGGEVADESRAYLDDTLIEREERFDGFYAVCTNLEDDVKAILAVNKRRWQIEACFRILKYEFEARPVYLSRDDRIDAHFITCFLSLLLFRVLEHKLAAVAPPDLRVTPRRIIATLNDYGFYHLPGKGYLPTYTRTEMTDLLHTCFGFQTDTEIVPQKRMRKIIRETKR